ncbi:MAG TPA: ribosome biogenesis GTPase Der [Actinomycetota bacterium]|nr:ribosome biogenesis GTPase Der [Actinomycetota bacterium]
MSASAIPSIAVVGRQNVGKSTLVNRLFGRRATIAHGMPGVTRDRLELEASWNGRTFGLVDTAGYVHGAQGIEARAAEQAERAIASADLIVFVVDVQAGVTDEDGRLAARFRRSSTPVLLVANKADSPNDLADVATLHRLGLGEPFPVSALHGQGTGDLLDRIVELLPDRAAPADPHDERRFAIVGRPNVGKSSLFNRLVGEERAIVSDVAGTTRDAIDSLVDWPTLGRVRFVDTAGMRRGTKVRGVEYYSVLRAAEAIEGAHVAVLVLDAVGGFTTEDKKIANRVMDAGRALLVVANRWDLVEEKDETFKRLGDELSIYASAEVVRTSALTGLGVHRLPSILVDLHRRWTSEAPTSVVNDLLQQAQRERPTPRSASTLHYVTQVATGPPTFTIFGGARPPDAGYRRYLENRFRRELHLDGVPIRLRFRARERKSRRPREASGGEPDR